MGVEAVGEEVVEQAGAHLPVSPNTARGKCLATAWPNDIGITTPVQRPTYPNTWLRLERMGSKFWGYASTDGQSWTLLRGSPYDFNALNGNETTPRVDGNMANTLALGMAVTAHNDGDLTGGIGVFTALPNGHPNRSASRRSRRRR